MSCDRSTSLGNGCLRDQGRCGSQILSDGQSRSRAAGPLRRPESRAGSVWVTTGRAVPCRLRACCSHVSSHTRVSHGTLSPTGRPGLEFLRRLVLLSSRLRVRHAFIVTKGGLPSLREPGAHAVASEARRPPYLLLPVRRP